MYQYDQSSHPIEVRCPRDPGFRRTLQIHYYLSNENKIFFGATCKLDGKTETCNRCRSAVVTMCRLNGLPSPGELLVPDLRSF